jgi:NTE family protein
MKTQETVKIDRLIVSDASPPLYKKEIPSILSPFRLKRLIDIALSQVRALRVRSFVNFIKTHSGAGMYLRIGEDAFSAICRLGEPESRLVQELKATHWLSSEEAEKAAHYPTTLKRMHVRDFDLIVQHGYETAQWNAKLWEAQAT